jgi:lipoprotein-releasing system permease protein
MRFGTYVALRFLRSRRSRFVSLITIIAVLGITIGVVVLNVTLAVMNGFRDQIQLTFVENMPMVTVLDRSPEGLRNLDEVTDEVEAVDGVVAASPFIRSPIIVTLERVAGRPRHKAGIAWGIRAEQQDRVTPISKSITPPFAGFSTEKLLGGADDLPGIVLGSELGAGLYAAVGDIVMVTAPRNISGQLDKVSGASMEFMVVGLLATGMYEFDNTFVYMDLGVAQQLFERGDSADGIGVRVQNMMRAPEVGRRIEAALGSPPYFTNDWIALNQQLFDWIRMEKTLMFLLLLIITLVAVFCMVAILMMMVRDRQRDIGIFLSLGASRVGLLTVFVQLGMVIGATGVVAGTALGLLICFLLNTVGLPLPADIYFVDQLPVHVKTVDVGLIAVVALGMTFLATLVPSWMASRLPPVEVLRYE